MNIARLIRTIIIFVVSFSGFVYVYRTLVGRKGPLVRVLVFHDVTDERWFLKMVSYLKEHYRVLTPHEFETSRFDTGKINVLVTFDDGYESWITKCLPILGRLGVRGVFFINSGLIDSTGDIPASQKFQRERLLLTHMRKTLDWEGVQALIAEGHTIGGHTTTHARLSELQDDEAEREIGEDKARIETMIGKGIDLFAYPFGQFRDYTKKTKTFVKRAEYSHTFTTESSFYHGGDPYHVPRLCLEDNLSTHTLRMWVLGGYDLYSKIKGICVR